MISIVGQPKYLRFDYGEGSGSGSGSLIGDSFLKGNKNDFILFQVVLAIARYAIAKDVDGSRIQFNVTGFANPQEVIQSQNIIAFKEFQTGDTIDITSTNGTTNNRTAKVITKIDDQTIRIIGETFSAFLEITAQLIDKQPITDVLFLYNLIENTESINYTSKVDGTSDCSYKSYPIGALDATDLITVRNLIGQGNKSWQYGFANEVEIQGRGAFGSGSSDSYSQYFKIEQRFYIHPFYLDQSWDDILLNNLESYFIGTKCLKHIFKVIASTGLGDPNKIQTGEFANILGDTGGFDENFNNNPTNYSTTPVVYSWNTMTYSQLKLLSVIEYATSPMIAFSFQLKNTIDNPFTSATKLNINFNVACDIIDQQKASTIFQNFCFDNVDIDALPQSKDGFQVGTDQQVFGGASANTGVSAALTSSSIITISGFIKFSSTQLARILTLANKRYELTVNIFGSDGVTLLVDANDFLIEFKDPNAIDVLNISFKKLDTIHPNNLKAFPSSGVIASVSVKADLTHYSPTDIEFIQSRMKIIALKNDGTNFVLDEFDYNFGVNVIAAGRVLLNILVNRNFKLLPTDDFNKIFIANLLDTGSVHFYSFIFPFMTRWEYWKALIANVEFFDNTKQNNNLNNYWFHYQNANWGVYYKLELDVKIKGNLVTYSDEKQLTLNDYNSNPGWDVNRKIQVFDLDGTEIVNAGTSFCYSDEDVRIVATFETSSTIAILSGGSAVNGIIRLEPFEGGGTTAIMEVDTINDIASIACFKPLAGQTKVKKTATTTKITFEILTDHKKIPVGTKLTCYAEIMAGEYQASTVDPAPLTWTETSGNPAIVYALANFGATNKIIGNALWNSDWATTFDDLVTSMNTNTDSDPSDSTGMKANTGFATFDNSAGYVGSTIFVSASIQPANVFWGPLGTTGSPQFQLLDQVSGKSIGYTDWDTDENTTLAKLVISVNTNTPNGTIFNGAYPFGPAHGYTASYNSSTHTFTISPPANVRDTYNGRTLFLATNGGTVTFPGGIQGKSFSGGVDEVNTFTITSHAGTGASINGQQSLFFSWGGTSSIVTTESSAQTWAGGASGGAYIEDCTKKDLTTFAKYADAIPSKPSALASNNLCADWVMTVLATSQSSGSGSGGGGEQSGPESDVNDYAGIIFKCSPAIVSATLTLQKLDCNKNILSTHNLNDNTYGKFFGFGFISDDVANNYIAYKIEWGNVLALLGEGIYKIICTKNPIVGNPFDIDWLIPNYGLLTYTAANAEGTVLIETITTEFQVDLLNPAKWFYYGQSGFRNSIRLRGIFGYNNYTETREFDEYRNGERKWISDEQKENYELHLKAFPGWLHKILSNWILQADTKFITDYNRYNAYEHLQTQVISDGDWIPDNDTWKFNQNKKRPVVLKFIDAFNNRRKKRQGIALGTGSSGGASFDDSFDNSFDE